MKYIIISVAVVVAIVGALLYRNSTVSTEKHLQANTTIVDVRTPQEFAESHVIGAQNFPLETMQAGTMPTYAKDTSIALYCHSGRRAGEALTLMKQAGYTNVISLGGLDDLASYGLALTN